jgi:hypothetical protein
MSEIGTKRDASPYFWGTFTPTLNQCPAFGGRADITLTCVDVWFCARNQIKGAIFEIKKGVTTRRVSGRSSRTFSETRKFPTGKSYGVRSPGATLTSVSTTVLISEFSALSIIECGLWWANLPPFQLADGAVSRLKRFAYSSTKAAIGSCK